MTVCINGRTYPMATTLRVAYVVQGMHNHKPYSEVFQSLDKMPLEDQIGILYAAFSCANPQEKSVITDAAFLNYYLDNFTLKEVMGQLKQVIDGIMGTTGSSETTEPEASQEQ